MRYYLILTSFFCAFTSLFATDVSVKKAQKAPTLDGIISAGEWERIEREFTTVPSLGKPERLTELYMLYDDDNIYVALKHDEEVESEDDAVFSLPHFEMRFGEGKKIDYFVATLDGKKVPAQGWDVVWGNKVIECRIPLEIMTGFRIYTGNITRTGHRLKSGESSSLFPIQKQNFVDPSFHGRFLLGAEEEISAAKEALGGNRQTRLAAAEKMAALLQPKEQHLLGEKASSYSASKYWQPYKFYTGKDFHFMFRPKYEKNSRFFVPGFAESLPIFRDAAYQVHSWYLNRGFREKLQPIKKLLEDSEDGVMSLFH